MRQIPCKTTCRILTAGAAALALTLLMLTVLGAAAKGEVLSVPIRANDQVVPARTADPSTPITDGLRLPFPLPRRQRPITPVLRLSFPPPGPQEAITPTSDVAPLPDWVVGLATAGHVSAAADGVTIVKSANEFVDLGDVITYTIVVSNDSPHDIENILVVDVLPEGTLEGNVSCVNCVEVMHTELIPPVETFYTDQVRWELASLSSDSAVSATFFVRVTGQADGTDLGNRAYLRYRSQGITYTVTSSETHTTVRVSVEPGVGASLSAEPTWLSLDMRETNSLAWGDFDNDGDLDLALGSERGTAIYRNEQGRLTAKAVWSSGDNASTRSVAWGDMDGDGDLDLATGNWNQVNRVYRNNGGGDFTGENIGTIVGQTTSVAWGDVDGDGWLDLAVGDYNGSGKVYRNNNGTLQATVSWSSIEPNRIWSVAWGDVNNDGHLDLAVGDRYGPNRVYLNHNGILPLVASWSSADGDDTYSVAWGDVDGDGYLDLAVGNQYGPNKVYRNGNGTLQTVASWFSADSDDTYSVAWGDMDGDGDLDLVVGNLTSPAKVYLNERGVLQSVGKNLWSPRNLDPTLDVAWGDMNGDGDLDLAIGNYGHPNNVHLNEGAKVQTAAAWSSAEWDHSVSVAWGDVDDDGDLDLAAGNLYGPNRVYENVSGTLQTVAAWSSADMDYTWSVAWGDVDGDGDLDLAAGNDFGPNRVYENVSGTLQTLAAWSSGDYDYTYSVAWGDVDDDGDLDLAAGNLYAPNKVYENVSGTLQTVAAWSSADMDYTWSVAWGDVDGDGDLDLAAGNDWGQNRVYENVSGTLQTVAAWSSGDYDYTYSVAWGDVDGDGDLDLATGNLYAPNKVYENVSGTLQTVAAWSSGDYDCTYSVAWGDVDDDGDLDLAAGNWYGPNKIYQNVGGTLRPPADEYGITSVAWGDVDNDGDLDLVLGNYYGPSLLFTNFASLLPSSLSQSIDAWSANSVAWGDADGDDDLDLVFGAGASEVNARLYYNEDGVFSAGSKSPFLSSGFGPHDVAFGDVDGDGNLDIALSTTGENQVYAASNPVSPRWTSASSPQSCSVAWGDADDDGDLDLLAGNDGANALYLNQSGQLDAFPVWTSDEADTTPGIAWTYLDSDQHLGFEDFYPWFAVGNDGQHNGICRNNQDNTFSLDWNFTFFVSDTTSVAWADYDGDGDPDLTVGNYGGPNLIYENENGSFGLAPIWRSEESSNTTSLAWGDWDNDGDLDLAVGNDGQPDQVYLNRESKPGSPRLLWLWSSQEVNRTTGVAWGDQDGDGDLDLAISSDGQIGIYENNYVLPSHLTDVFTPTMLLPNNSSYLAIDRPGDAQAAYFFSAPKRLAGALQPTVTIHYKLFDPDGTRDTSVLDEPGDNIIATAYEFSLDGGGTWKPATGIPSANWITPTRQGSENTFVWNAQNDQAISDNARFRITIFYQNPFGPIQRASTSAVSPPFRVRGLTCVWPETPLITSFVPDEKDDPKRIHFKGKILGGSGILTFTWDFGDGTSLARGQEIEHTYAYNGVYPVTMTVASEPCPLAKVVTATATITVGSGIPDRLVYLPVVMKSLFVSQEEDTVDADKHILYLPIILK